MNIVIVDDHPLVRQGLSAIISLEEDMKIIGGATTAAEAVQLVSSLRPDIALVDLRLAETSGWEVIKLCKEKVPLCKYIVLTSSVDKDDFRKAGEIGVDGYLLKEAYPEEIISAIRLVQKGRKYYDPGMIELMLEKQDDDPFKILTLREREVLQALSEGLSNKDIAKKLFITECTVKKHVSQILSKLELTDRTHAALYARENGAYLSKC